MYKQGLSLKDKNAIAPQCKKKLQDLVSQCTRCPEITDRNHSFAEFVIKRTVTDPGEIVALGTGNKCLSCKHIREDGHAIIDSFALAIARRALLRYFYNEVLHKKDDVSIFETIKKQGRYQMKADITLHLYLSDPPLGDYRECLDFKCGLLNHQEEERLQDGAYFPIFNEHLPGWFSVTNNDGTVVRLENNDKPVQNFSRLQQGVDDLLVMLSSDKLLLWNMVGVQGALFSAFLRPVYIDSIILGRDDRHFVQAVSCRLYDVIKRYLPDAYKLNRSIVSTLKFDNNEISQKIATCGLNWTSGDEKPEIVNGFTGRVIKTSPCGSTHKSDPNANRLCKGAQLLRFQDIGRKLNRSDMLAASMYSDAKQLASNYQEAKTIFKKFGHWITMPQDIEKFLHP